MTHDSFDSLIRYTRKEKEKKKRTEKQVLPDSNSGSSAREAVSLPLGHMEHTEVTRIGKYFIKPFP